MDEFMLNVYKDQYYFELARRDSLFNKITVLLSVFVLLSGGFLFLGKEFYIITDIVHSTFLIFIPIYSLFISMLLLSGYLFYLFIRTLIKHNYKALDNNETLLNDCKVIKNHYEKNLDKTYKKITIEFRKKIVKAQVINFKINNFKENKIYYISRCLVLLFTVQIITYFVYFLILL